MQGTRFSAHIVQEAPQLLTIARLVEAGLRVTILPACVERIAPPGVVCRRLRGTRVNRYRARVP